MYIYYPTLVLSTVTYLKCDNIATLYISHTHTHSYTHTHTHTHTHSCSQLQKTVLHQFGHYQERKILRCRDHSSFLWPLPLFSFLAPPPLDFSSTFLAPPLPPPPLFLGCSRYILCSLLQWLTMFSVEENSVTHKQSSLPFPHMMSMTSHPLWRLIENTQNIYIQTVLFKQHSSIILVVICSI